MMYFKCDSCGRYYEEDFAPEFCECGRRLEDEAYFCRVCGNLHYSEECASAHCCKECCEEHLTTEEFDSYLNESHNTVDFYVVWQFGLSRIMGYSEALEDLVALCKKHFSEKSDDEKKDQMKSYLEEGLLFDEYGDYISEKNGKEKPHPYGV